MTEAHIRSLRLRGHRAARLARVAATELPGALDAALADVGDVAVDSIAVRLDVDSDEVDARTLAILWADAIRAAVLAAAETASTSSPPSRANVPHENVGARLAPPTAAVSAVAAEAWIAATTPRPPLPWRALALMEAAATEGGDAVHELARRLERAIASERASLLSGDSWWGAHAEYGRGDAADGAPTRATDAPSTAPREPGGPPSRARDISPDASDNQADVSALATLAALADVTRESPSSARSGASPNPRDLDVSRLTSAAGLVLLYPWLGDYLDGAVAAHPGLDEARVRARALALLADPLDSQLESDPLILFLAGASSPASGPLDVPREGEVLSAADAVLRGFAALLPGFARSSPDFVRVEWIQRWGLLDAERAPALLTAATHPLDVVLARLPYPVGLIRLPWSELLTVRFRP